MGESVLTLDVAGLRAWIGRSETAVDVVAPRLEASFRATLDRTPGQPTVGDPATLGLHWCLAPSIEPMQALGDDGHPRRGVFLPPVPLPRRMWAGGELEILAPLQVGDVVTRMSRIEDVVVKAGRTGTLCFVTVRHSLRTPRGPVIDERQDIVYRPAENGTPAAAPPAAAIQPEAVWHRSWPCDPTLLFRFSALTFNGHRIHYDRPYATQVEGYPDLVVHGPMQATALMALAAEVEGMPPRRFGFRGVAPLFADGPFTAEACPEGDRLRLWINGHNRRTTMTAYASW